MLLEIEISQAFEAPNENVWLLAVSGELDFHTASRFRLVFDEVLPPPGDGLVLDLSDLSYFDSSGLAAVLALLERTNSVGAHLATVSGSRRVDRILDVTAMHDALGAVDTRAEAVAAVGNGATRTAWSS
jgi:anti-sigma B factor antagonist